MPFCQTSLYKLVFGIEVESFYQTPQAWEIAAGTNKKEQKRDLKREIDAFSQANDDGK